MAIHPTAQIDPRAEIHPDAEIGPFVVIDGPARVGRGTRIMAHAVLTGATVLGEDNVVHYGAVLGHEPQDLAYRDAPTGLVIGHRNVIREQAFLHRGTKAGTATVVGDDNYLMAHSHLGHNVRLGNRVILCPGVLLGGYVEVADQVFISGNCVVHQFVRIGRLALLRGLSKTSRDVPPFCIMDNTHEVRAINAVGLRRAGFRREQIQDLRRAFSHLFKRRRNLRLATAELAQQASSDEVRELLAFIADSRRGVCFGPRTASERSSDTDE